MTVNNRIEWIDIAKGFSIILVVYGHSWLSSVPFFGDWFGSFRMPFFFFVSGLLFNPKKTSDPKAYLKKKYEGLIRPFIIFSLCVLLSFYMLDTTEFHSRIEAFPLHGWGGYALWFIPVLFTTNVAYFFLRKFIRNTVLFLTALAMSTVIGFALYRYGVTNYWNLNFVFTSVAFYGIGNLLASKMDTLFKASTGKIIAFFIVAALTSLVFLLDSSRPEFGANYLGGGKVTHLAAISGSLMMCSMAAIISRTSNPIFDIMKTAVKYLGRNSYVVLAFHQIILLLFAKYIPEMPGLLSRLSMWLILVLLIEFITRQIPYVLGRKKIKIYEANV